MLLPRLAVTNLNLDSRPKKVFNKNNAIQIKAVKTEVSSNNLEVDAVCLTQA